jgi:very-short-patch-repair endonuclease
VEGSLDERIAAVAERQHGVFTLADADAAGFTRAQRDRRIRSGRWVSLHDRVYRIAGAPLSWEGRLRAACWAAHGLAVASHRSAAQLRDLPGGGADLVEITCKRWKRTKCDGLVVHETKLIDDVDIECVRGIPTTSVEQTLMGLAAVVPDTVVEMAIDRALYKKLTTITRLEQFVHRKGKRGRNGVGVLRELVRNLDPLAGIPESPKETQLKQLLRSNGLPMPEFQYEIRHEGRLIARVDAAYPEHRIAIEYDSYEHHIGRRAIDRDSSRRAVLSRIRWETITFTAAALNSNGGEALETLRIRLGFGAPIASL